MFELYDTHCHLNIEDSFPDPSRAIAEAREAGVTRINVIGIDLDSSARAIEIATMHEGVYATVGVHPNSSASFKAADVSKLHAMAAHPKAIAIGEVGLDYYWDHATPMQQREALIDQLDLAQSLEKPVVFHCREAYGDLIDLLEARTSGAWLLHCFSGTAEDARRAVRLGCYFGIDGPITYPKAATLRDIAGQLPRDKVVIETDSPYLTPAPHRGKPNKPAFVVLVNSALASCLRIGEEECARLTTENALRFFRL